LGVPSYRTRRYINTALKTAQQLYLLFGQAIYDVCVQQLTQIILDGESEVDESMYMVATGKASAGGALPASISSLACTKEMASSLPFRCRIAASRR
jgi:hypothetical protein